MSEHLRVERLTHFPHLTKCLTCGKAITLWYNGGELDQTECCGKVYELQGRGTDFVVRDVADDD